MKKIYGVKKISGLQRQNQDIPPLKEVDLVVSNMEIIAGGSRPDDPRVLEIDCKQVTASLVGLNPDDRVGLAGGDELGILAAIPDLEGGAVPGFVEQCDEMFIRPCLKNSDGQVVVEVQNRFEIQVPG